MQKAATKKTETKAPVTVKEEKNPRSKSQVKEEKTKPEKNQKAANNIKNKEKEKDKDEAVAIKRAKNPYMFFVQDSREKVKKENPELKNKELLSLLGKMWNEMNDDQKKKYNDMSSKDRERYQKEKDNTDNAVGKKNNKKRKQSVAKDESK